MSQKGIQKIFSSPLIRARETATILADSIDCSVETVDDLKERNQYGILAGIKKEEAQERYPELVENLKDRMNIIQGAESYENFRNHVVSGIETVLAKSEQENLQIVAVVWHGGPMRVLFRDYLKWGDLTTTEDCCWAEFGIEQGVWRTTVSEGITFAFDTEISNDVS